MRHLKRVLIADDNRVFRAVLEEVFAAFGAAVESVATGREAFDRLAAGGIDLAMVDILMPQMDGFEVLDRLAAETFAGLSAEERPIIFLTTAVYKGRRWENEARQTHGAHEFLPKPVDPDELRTVLERYFVLS